MTSALRLFVASVWLVHGLYNKLLGASPRHLAIVQSVPGLGGVTGERVLMLVGVFEVAVAVWILSGRASRLCAAAQTAALLSMNIVELSFARSLLLWPAGLLPLNIAFLSMAWVAAGVPWPTWLRARLRRHPIPIDAHFDHCLALTYAVPADVLRPLLPAGLELETVDGQGFIAVALVQTRSLRPSGLPLRLGQDFFLAGYRVFVRFRSGSGRTLRGLRILRSDADRLRMVVGGNLFTHYNYHHCDARLAATADRIDVAVTTRDGAGDLDITADLSTHALPERSPFATVRDARRFAGPLPFTFDYEAETDAVIAIEAERTNWAPAPVSVKVRRLAFFDQPAFADCTPVLAAAFHVSNIDYRWRRGVRHALAQLTHRAAA
jgi:uncharacterized protein YqjF (DUF2071 family)/uncharacterized membrane protein YphA (DoxX/SURF4 family)